MVSQRKDPTHYITIQHEKYIPKILSCQDETKGEIGKKKEVSMIFFGYTKSIFEV